MLNKTQIPSIANVSQYFENAATRYRHCSYHRGVRKNFAKRYDVRQYFKKYRHAVIWRKMQYTFDEKKYRQRFRNTVTSECMFFGSWGKNTVNSVFDILQARTSKHAQMTVFSDSIDCKKIPSRVSGRTFGRPDARPNAPGRTTKRTLTKKIRYDYSKTPSMYIYSHKMKKIQVQLLPQ